MAPKRKYNKKNTATSQRDTVDAATEGGTQAQATATANAAATPPNTSDADVRGAIQLLTQILANQTQRQETAPSSGASSGSNSSRTQEFMRMKPPVSTRSKKEEDPQNFIDGLQKIFRVMHATDTEAAELGAFQLQDVAHICHGGSQGDGNRQFFKNRSSKPAPSISSAPFQRSKFNQKGRNFGMAGSHSQASVTDHGFQHPTCNTCGKRHSGVCRSGMDGYFGCGQPGHFLRDCSSARQNTGGNSNVAQTTNSTAPRNS
ncbi:uncharacterized protein LOC132612808 [Lycium barbarum]|uniref:uncharacterized protein LOC132612808 n=1 Tax=Lycium barbarum TaxID=112863 RepID=UPI00293F1BAF|nr:uncharacterized protein LOC132612808 [Lycium barbarum]